MGERWAQEASVRLLTLGSGGKGLAKEGGKGALASGRGFEHEAKVTSGGSQEATGVVQEEVEVGQERAEA